MTQAEMIVRFAATANIPAAVAKGGLDDFFAEISRDLAKGNRVILPGIGHMSVVATAPLTNVRNPRTGAALPDKPAGRRVKLTMSAAFKAELAETAPSRAAAE